MNTKITENVELPPMLTANDRCDASQSEAATTVYVRPNGETLMFCDHHARKHDSALKRMGYQPL